MILGRGYQPAIVSNSAGLQEWLMPGCGDNGGGLDLNKATLQKELSHHL